MKLEFDDTKDKANRTKHGVSLARAAEMDVLAFVADDRKDYGEVRYRAWGLIDGLAYCLAFTDRNGTLRAISLRRAHKKEMARYVPPRSD